MSPQEDTAPEVQAPAAADAPVTIAALHSGAHVASKTARLSLWHAAPAALQAEPTPHAAATAAAAVLGVLEIYCDGTSFRAVEVATGALARVQEADAGAAFAKALVLCLRSRTAGGDAAGVAGLTDLGYAQALRLLCVAQCGSFATLCGTADKAADGFDELAALQERPPSLKPRPRPNPSPSPSPSPRPEPASRARVPSPRPEPNRLPSTDSRRNCCTPSPQRPAPPRAVSRLRTLRRLQWEVCSGARRTRPRATPLRSRRCRRRCPG